MPSKGFEATVGETATSVLLPFVLKPPCVHFSDLTDKLCVSETLFPSVKFCNVIHPWHKQRSKGYGAEGSSAERTESCCFHSYNYWKPGLWGYMKWVWVLKHELTLLSLAACIFLSYLRYKATSLMESCSLSHNKSGGSPLRSTKCDTQCLTKSPWKTICASKGIRGWYAITP